MFLGTFQHSLDNKNRLSLPTKFINLLPKTIVVNKGFDGCLEIRSADDFKTYINKIIDYPHTKKGTRDISREVIANAADIEIDGANRILIPSNLLAEAKIKKNIVILGIGNRIELWDSKIYETYKEVTDKTYTEIAELLDDRKI